MSQPSTTNLVEPLMTAEDISGTLVVPLATVYQWRSRGLGPPAIKVGKHLRYRRRDLERWLDEQAKR